MGTLTADGWEGFWSNGAEALDGDGGFCSDGQEIL